MPIDLDAQFLYPCPQLTSRQVWSFIHNLVEHRPSRLVRSLPSGTWLEARFAIRPYFINPRSGLVDDVIEIGRILSRG